MTNMRACRLHGLTPYALHLVSYRLTPYALPHAGCRWRSGRRSGCRPAAPAGTVGGGAPGAGE